MSKQKTSPPPFQFSLCPVTRFQGLGSKRGGGGKHFFNTKRRIYPYVADFLRMEGLFCFVFAGFSCSPEELHSPLFPNPVRVEGTQTGYFYPLCCYLKKEIQMRLFFLRKYHIFKKLTIRLCDISQSLKDAPFIRKGVLRDWRKNSFNRLNLFLEDPQS